MANETMTFKEAYGILQGHAETLRSQTEPNIDDLLAIVEESVGAYRVCKARIDAVEKALERALTDVGAETAPGASARVSRSTAPAPADVAPAGQKPASGFDDMDDDIPF